uniref:Polyketide synthase n=1 Tax=uncultured bacterium AB_9 TaxID=1630012 RepID=A0A0E3M0I4_9BACT|nr:polyketide synthase [uncultured bacterium AB_9]
MDDEEKLAIVGLACRFPGADTAARYWANLRAGRDTVRRFTAAEAIAAGVPPAVAHDPRYVPARGVISGGDLFDWTFFGYTRAEAAGMDPQHRLLLECAVAALDDAAIDPGRFPGPIGVVAGCDAVPAPPGSDEMARHIGYDRDFLASRVAYKLALRGPALTVQAACATSLVAVHVAAQSLLSYECDAVLAGGVGLELPETVGYLHQEGHILSADGHCRAFDARAGGTVPGSGVGMVVLRRLADALRDGDRVVAVIRGSAVTNDGAAKVGYTAPGVAGQREVIGAALARADVQADDIGYVEAHGTGTRLGDPVELAALTAAFREHTDRVGFCRIGAVKSNIGHANSAAGVAGLIKTALMLQHREFVPTLHVTRPNPELHLADSPFRICTEAGAWPDTGPLLAGVSSFGIGGVNAHAVLEGPPSRARPATPAGPFVLQMSAFSAEAMTTLRSALADTLEAPDAPAMDSVTRTLNSGRPRYRHRFAVVGNDAAEVAARLRAGTGGVQPVEGARVAFLFPGQGTLRGGVARAPYARLRRFREVFDMLAGEARDRFGTDLAPMRSSTPNDSWFLDTVHQQLGLFVLGYALSEQWAAWGVTPCAMAGHSIGEYVAATVAGVWTPAEALELVHARARAMRDSPPGRMLAVPLDPAATEALLPAGTAVTVAVAGADHTVLSGPPRQVEALCDDLAARGIGCRMLHTGHAFHSEAMRDAAEHLHAAVSGIGARLPAIPYVANLTGDWAPQATAPDADYWTAQLCRPVLLGKSLATLLDGPADLLLELGPGNSMTGSARRHPARRADQAIVPLLAGDAADADATLLRGLATAWQHGLPVDESIWALPEGTLSCALPPHPMLSVSPARPPAAASVTGTPAPPSGTGAPEATGLTSPAWMQTPSGAGQPRRLGVAGELGAFGAAAVVRALGTPDAVVSATCDLATAAPDGADLFVAVLPTGAGASDVDELDRAADTTGRPVVVLGRRLFDVLGAEPVDPVGTDLTAWSAYRRRRGPAVHILDVGTEGEPVGAPALRPGGGCYAWRGRRWWFRGDAPVVDALEPDTSRPAPEKVVVVADEPAIADRMAGAGVTVAGLLVPAGAAPDPLALTRDVSWTPPAARLSARPELTARLDAWCTALIGRMIAARAGLRPGERLSAAELRRRLTTQDRLHRLVEALLGMITDAGLLARSGDMLTVAPDLADRVRAAAQPPAGLGEVDGLRRLVEHCVAAYPQVLAGERDPVSVLFPDGSGDFLAGLLAANDVAVDDSEPCVDLLAAAVRAQAERDRPLRVLEVGGGQGTLVSRILDGRSAGARLDYHFTDISPLFVRAAAQRHGSDGPAAVRCTTFDLTRDPVSQGLVPGSYDVVLSYNAVHVAPSLPEALRRLAGLLRPDGWMGLVELTRVSRWVDAVWGLAPGWWDHDDALRTDSIHLDTQRWVKALAEAGLPEVAVLPPDRVHADHAVLIAARPAGETTAEDDLERQGVPAAAPAVVVGAYLPEGLHRPVWSMTTDSPTSAGWRGERERDTRVRSGPEHRHLRVAVADAAVYAALPRIVGRDDLPTDLRFSPAPRSAEPSPAADRAAPPVAVVDDLERRLAGIWCDLLGVDAATPDDDLFVLGGDSLMSVHLMSRVREATGLDLPFTRFMSQATFGELLRLARERRAPLAQLEENLLLLPGAEPSAGRPPLFFVAPGAGSSLCYRDLVRRLAPDRACYGLETPGLHDGRAPLTAYEDIAEHHLALVRSVHPSGPYLLAGWSIGAVIAHEMAVRDGDRVPLVIGIDGHVAHLGGLTTAVQSRGLSLLARSPWRRLRGAMGAFLQAGEGAPDFTGVFHANLRALRRYRAGRSPSAAAVLVTRRGRRARAALAGRLARFYAGPVDVRPVTGSHWTVLEQASLTEAMRHILDQRDGSAPTSGDS